MAFIRLVVDTCLVVAWAVASLVVGTLVAASSAVSTLAAASLVEPSLAVRIAFMVARNPLVAGTLAERKSTLAQQ